ncbi:MAG TPA: Stk1 family PASTA domain-containing Ser/Thr kinase [Propionibacteriaceae bacterium]|nr:Stk1 family PASTA domain-containing Ser/Thr kinase [Propionibacteriaceae bacterium]
MDMTSSPTTVGGRYELGELLGRGGMAEVRRAVDQRLGRAVAVKQLRADLAIDPTFQARFRREAQSAAGLNHPTIVAVYDTGEEVDPLTGVAIPYIVMELVEGPTLRDVLREGRKILPERALELTQGVLEALSYSHKAGIVHRDIKPANVMLTPNGGVKVMDFGIARAVADTSATMTQTAAVIGTAQYLSPEQARGETVDARSDLYSTGCLLYELLAGRPPFVGDSPVSVAYQHVREAPVPPSQLDPEITPEIDAVVLKALAKDPDDRYQSAAEMRADISRLLSGEQTTAQRTTAVVPMAAGAMAANAFDTPTHVAGPPTILPPEPVEEGEYEEEEPQKSRVGLAILIAALIVLALGLGGWALYRVLNPADAVAKVEVPSVLGWTEQQARDQLTANNLLVEVKKANGDEETKGTITAQDPVAGTEVLENSTVTITLNEGPKTGKIPGDLVGQDVDEVENALDDLKFSNVSTVAAKSEDPDTQPGEVISISPKEGSTVPLDSKITVRYATGKSEVPNFQGLTRAAATRQARNAGFGEPQFSERESSKPVGTVIAQSPDAGATVDRDARIELTLATAPPPPPPPTTEQPTEPPTTSTTRPTPTPTATSASTSTPSQGESQPPR